jgi:hypothetical protein
VVISLSGEADSFCYRKILAHNSVAGGLEGLGQFDLFFAIVDHECVVFAVR